MDQNVRLKGGAPDASQAVGRPAVAPAPEQLYRDWRMAMLLLGSLVLIALPIGLMHPSYINQDTYQYVAVANSYFQPGPFTIRDAHTVGPVIPGAVAAAKWAASLLFSWSADVDVAIVKLLALGCYAVIACAALVYHRRQGIAPYLSALGIGIALFTIPTESDSLSFNGDLACSALIAVFIAIAAAPSRRWGRNSVLVLISLVVTYTKLQAILILGLCFGVFFAGKERLKIVAAVAGAVTCTEIVLWFTGGGWTSKATALGAYVLHGQSAATHTAGNRGSLYTTIASHVSHLMWVTSGTLRYFPIVAAVAVAFAVKRQTDRREMTSAWLWAGVTLATIIIPGHSFEHYLMFEIPAVIVLSAMALQRLNIGAPSARAALITLAVMVGVKFCSIMPDANLFGHGRYLAIFPRQFISGEAVAAKAKIRIGPHDSLFVHGWDYRFYSYLNKPKIGPEIGFVEQGALSAQDYMTALLRADPTIILDVVNHSGLTRSPSLALAANPAWRDQIAARYDKVLDDAGLVVYKKRTTKPGVELLLPPGVVL